MCFVVYVDPSTLGGANTNIVAIQKKTIYGTGAEAKAVRRELNGFDAKNSMAWSRITSQYGNDIRLNDLKAIAKVIEQRYPSKVSLISRNACRSLPLLIKWFQDNLDFIDTILQYIELQ